MHQSLHDYYWIYAVVIAVLFGAVFYLTPKLAMKFLNKSVDRKNRRAKNDESGKTAGENKHRYRTF